VSLASIKTIEDLRPPIAPRSPRRRPPAAVSAAQSGLSPEDRAAPEKSVMPRTRAAAIFKARQVAATWS
jgi:hypothetical protein